MDYGPWRNFHSLYNSAVGNIISYILFSLLQLICSYSLTAFISHMGTSSHSGHYVCHIKDEEGRWKIYNDNKVALSVNPPRELGYLYLYKRTGL